MLTVVICMLCGVLFGIFLRKKRLKHLNTVILILIWILLFLLGYEIGSNNQVIRQSGKILWKAFLIATAGTLGSIIAAKLIGKRIDK